MTPPETPEEAAALERLYADFAAENLLPLWTQLGDLMPMQPKPSAKAHVWKWKALYPLAQQAGELVPVGRGGERRAIALANPGLGGRPYATPTLWAAIQYLGPREVAPEHRHTQNAFRFVVEGEGVWTLVDGDPVAMRRGDLLLTPGWHFHSHHNGTDRPMAWIDGLDIPFQYYAESTFFEFGPDEVETRAAPERSRSERLWGHPGLRPLTHLEPTPATPLLAYRWEHTDRALAEQLALEAEGHRATVEAGHAAVRYVNPTTGGDVMPTLRTDFHRLAPGTQTAPVSEVGSSVFQVFDGTGQVTVGERTWTVEHGDMFAAPSWQPLQLATERGMDLFRFSDTPIFERLHQHRMIQENAK
ncbi:MAG: cupin domain-containing protein [Actinomadura sp.]